MGALFGMGQQAAPVAPPAFNPLPLGEGGERTRAG